jgi:DNA polymerase III gamma/tau subunit
MSLSEPATRPNSGSPADNRPTTPFDVALRGYERRQVDDYVARQRSEMSALRAQLAEIERQRRLATDHAEATEEENRRLRNAGPAPAEAPAEDGFGFRAEKLLRLAEQEAADIRARTRQESVALLEQTRAEAEKHRHEVEQSLIARAAQLDQAAARRTVELQEREQQIADQLEATRAEADGLHAAATRAADRLRQESEAKADEIRARAESDAKKVRDQAEHDLLRLTSLRSNVHAELARLAEVLVNELPKGNRGDSGMSSGSEK